MIVNDDQIIGGCIVEHKNSTQSYYHTSWFNITKDGEHIATGTFHKDNEYFHITGLHIKLEMDHYLRMIRLEWGDLDSLVNDVEKAYEYSLWNNIEV